MTLLINGEDRVFDSSQTLSDLVNSLGMKSDRVAVELNREIVSRDLWATTQLKDGDRLEIVYRSRDLARGADILFAATGISDSPLLEGVEVHGTTAVTHSVLMRSRSGTLRYLKSEHNMLQKTIHLHSTVSEVPI